MEMTTADYFADRDNTSHTDALPLCGDENISLARNILPLRGKEDTLLAISILPLRGETAFNDNHSAAPRWREDIAQSLL